MVLSLARKDPALFFQRFPTPLLIDEIQYAPELLPYIKLEVDRNRKPGSFWLTGSQPFHLMKELYRLIWRGAFPAIALNERLDRDLFYSSYVQTYLQRDIRDLSRVGDEMSFLRFLRAAAARTGQLLNLSELARDADIAVGTAKSWLSILQASGVAYLLEPYHTNVTKRLVKTPKLYFLDTGLCAYLTEWSSPETLASGATRGHHRFPRYASSCRT